MRVSRKKKSLQDATPLLQNDKCQQKNANAPSMKAGLHQNDRASQNQNENRVKRQRSVGFGKSLRHQNHQSVLNVGQNLKYRDEATLHQRQNLRDL
jgi:hypothetical protein